jgi:AcrR family transcriptional regulator
MIRKKGDAEPRRRGRPRAYDPQEALLRATDVFWKTGYAGTSLDEIVAATGMNRPSLYAAFGDKRALYREALARYWETSLIALREPLTEDISLDEALMRVYDNALSIYFHADGQPRGCFVIGTAITEANDHPEIRLSLAEGLRAFDADFEVRFQAALEKQEIKEGSDPAALAVLATATMHTIAIRARAGSPRVELRELALKAVKVICG